MEVSYFMWLPYIYWVQDGSVRRSWTYLLPQNNKYTGTYRLIPSERNLRTSWIPAPQHSIKRITQRWVESKTQSWLYVCSALNIQLLTISSECKHYDFTLNRELQVTLLNVTKCHFIKLFYFDNIIRVNVSRES